jgi:hypothetical protein
MGHLTVFDQQRTGYLPTAGFTCIRDSPDDPREDLDLDEDPALNTEIDSESETESESEFQEHSDFDILRLRLLLGCAKICSWSICGRESWGRVGHRYLVNHPAERRVMRGRGAPLSG